MLILALLEQLQLPSEHQYFLLLAGDGIIERAHRIFLIGQLCLYFDQ